MSLSLRSVSANQGALWMRDGFRLFGKHPLAFSLMFVAFLVAVSVVSIVPFAGAFVALSATPLLSLGFMVASESALNGGSVHPGQFFSPLKTDSTRRRSLLILCGLFGALILAVLWLAHTVDGGSLVKLQQLMQQAEPPQKQIEAIVESAEFQQGMLFRFGLMTLLSVPFWHAPALVHWGGQGPAQALFSSSLALWRSKGACVVYGLSWVALVMVFAVVTGLMLGLLGMRGLAGMLAVPAGLFFATVFYVSLIFTFNDSFGGSGSRAVAP